MKKSKILDTNVLLRFLVGDNKKEQKFAENQFEKAQRGDFYLIVHPIVIAETCFVLESFYKQKRKNIAPKLQVFLSQRWMKVQNRKVMLALWEEYLEGLHFVDSFLLAWARLYQAQLLTFDRELKSKKT